MRAVLTIGALLCAIAHPASATTLVAVWTPQTTALGADSLTHTLDGQDRWSICKIRTVGSVVWTATGITANPTMNFSLGRMAAAALSGDGDLDTRIEKFESARLPALAEAVEAIRTDAGAWYGRHVEGRPVTRVLFLENAGGANRLRLRDFVAHTSPLGAAVDIAIARTDCPGPACGGFQVLLLGQYDAAARIANDSRTWARGSLADGVRRSVEAEIAANPNHVGPPVAVVELAGAGVRWIDKGACTGSETGAE